MYVPEHLKWRILLARTLKSFYFESENSSRNLKRIFEVFGRYLLGTTYDTFLTYLNKDKYDLSNLRLPSWIVAALGLLDDLRITCERLYAQKPNRMWTLSEIVGELSEVLHEKEQERPCRKIRIDRP